MSVSILIKWKKNDQLYLSWLTMIFLYVLSKIEKVSNLKHLQEFLSRFFFAHRNFFLHQILCTICNISMLLCLLSFLPTIFSIVHYYEIIWWLLFAVIKKLNVKQFQFKQHNTSETDVTYEKVWWNSM